MKVERITREDLRAIRMGESRVFELPDYAAVMSARTSAYVLGRIDGCRFVISTEPDRNAITITRMPR
jgi:hypothetical protein